MSNVVFATVCSAHDVAHAIQPDAGHETRVDQTQSHPDENHDFGMLDSHCMHSTGVHAPCISGVADVPVALIAQHGRIVGAFPAPPSRPNEAPIRPPSFN